MNTAASYRGWTFDVPAGWPVVDLTTNPSTCVRFDVHAVYLGRPGAQQDCPSHLSGRTEAMLVEPIEDVAAKPDVESATASVQLPAAADSARAESAAQQVTVAVPSAGITVTASWSADRSAMAALLSTARPTVGWVSGPLMRTAAVAAPSRSSASVPATSIVGSSGNFFGEAFDACAAPSLNTMTAWLRSPYRAVGIYIGGLNRACSQPNLTANWISAVTRVGWRLIPIYVGRQAPYPSCGCTPIDPLHADEQGRAAADDAVSGARNVGIGAGSTLFNDMEEYARGTTNSRAVLTFLSAWTVRLHLYGYRSGVYSGPNSGIRDISLVTPGDGSGITVPDVVWYARWDGRDQASDDPALPADRWTHQRMHQYATGTWTWGGVRMNIDRSAVDATLSGPVNTPPPPPPPPPPPTVSAVLARAFVSRAYAVLLGRSPSSAEANRATWYISYGSSRTHFLIELVSSREWAAHWTFTEYVTMLRRVPDPSGDGYWTTWMEHAANPDVLAATLLASDERWSSSGSDATRYVNDLYRDVLLRSPAPSRTGYWVARLQSGTSRFEVALAFAAGQDRAARFVTGAFIGILGRRPDGPGLAYWSSVYARHLNPREVQVPLGASAEAISKP